MKKLKFNINLRCQLETNRIHNVSYIRDDAINIITFNIFENKDFYY